MHKDNENTERLKDWITIPNLDVALKDELTDLLAQFDAEGEDGAAAAEINDRFYRDLEFGTAGMRGLMGAGRNRMNVVTVRRASQGFANALLAKTRNDAPQSAIQTPANEPQANATPVNTCKDTPRSIVIAYDNRKNSDLFAYEAACVFAANGIQTYLFGRLSSTPLLSFAVRQLHADAGVVVTASHNGKKYNGYKIYDETGCQCRTEEADLVAECIAQSDYESVKTVADKYVKTVTDKYVNAVVLNEVKDLAATAEPLLQIIPDSLEEEFVQAVLAYRCGAAALDKLNVVYTPLNGTGNYPVRRVLSELGVGAVHIVPEQESPDPEFTTCPEPNPEKKDAFEVALALAYDRQAKGDAPDLILGTDPDCDRVGVMVYDGAEYVQLNGNQIGALLLDYLIEARKEKGDLPQNALMVTTIVSTPLAAAIAERNGIQCVKVLTGFKYIGEQINKLSARGEEGRFLFGFEESCGYLSGAHVRDKDAVNAVMLICEMAACYKQRGLTLIGRLAEIKTVYGHHEENLAEFVRPGEKGMSEIAAAMATVRDQKTSAGFAVPVIRVTDYAAKRVAAALSEPDTEARAVTDAQTEGRAAQNGDLPPADVVQYDTEGGGRIIFRPSGTEPKLKVYISARGDTAEEAACEAKKLRAAVDALAL